jgi:hypothetical protein
MAARVVANACDDGTPPHPERRVVALVWRNQVIRSRDESDVPSFVRSSIDHGEYEGEGFADAHRSWRGEELLINAPTTRPVSQPNL